LELPPRLPAGVGFTEAARSIVEFLDRHLPLGFWSVSRFDGERQVHLAVVDRGYGLGAGACVDWSASLCERMVAGVGPSIAPDATAVPAYVERATDLGLEVGTYVGIPIRRAADGALFGTLCGIDTQAHGPQLTSQQPLLEILVRLLAMVLDADLSRSELTRELERAELLAHTDPLTGLHNRRAWDRAVELEQLRLRRFGDPGAVLVLDLDELKLVNDRDGHAAGDRLLVAAATALRSVARSRDLVARLGGDEFGVLVTGTTPEGVPSLVERVRSHLASVGAEVSVGGSAAEPQRGYAGALERADAAMYEDKRRRRAVRPSLDVASAIRRTPANAGAGR
jgi:diguanylate cyclase